ncbi:DUF1007 family protein [Oceanotoga sp. DSM 15011]|jgi:ABC-type uncharacterized transport system substrate-binding protein|uniref:DUF1007 family protein n=1 Tax=Oceanotoga sp. DSM 15011 TaxID=2984951 RepID=UPI0021F4D5C7|nr:DUF1007 family protein [Oceanotoga sp. DSM 15011]UYP01174.1 DUF1007 family protein [Oceanotoga sp. DSM 15011]
MKKIFIYCAYTLISITIIAHPHVFIEVLTKINIKNDILEISSTWKFDDLMSMLLKKQYNDIDSINKKLQEKYKKENFFTTIYLNQKNLQISPLKIFSTELENRILFTMIYDLKLENNNNEIIISTYDKSYYTYLKTEKDDNINIIPNKNYEIESTIFANFNKLFYFDQIFPYEIKLIIRRK